MEKRRTELGFEIGHKAGVIKLFCRELHVEISVEPAVCCAAAGVVPTNMAKKGQIK